MNAPFPRSLTFVERLHIARELHARKLEEIEARGEEQPAQKLEPAPERPADTEEILAAPLHSCGVRMVLCPDCRAHYCRAPGHVLHVCRSAEFAQVSP